MDRIEFQHARQTMFQLAVTFEQVFPVDFHFAFIGDYAARTCQQETWTVAFADFI